MQAIPPVCRLTLVLLLAGGLGGCRTLKKESDGGEASTPAPASSTLPVGTVHHIDGTAGFVLIQSSRSLQIEPGTILTTYGEQGEVTARLEVSPARKGSFLTADIRDGAPKKGDRATMEHSPRPVVGGGPAFPSGNDAVQVLE